MNTKIMGLDNSDINIVDIVSSYNIALKSEGSNFLGKCPFHKNSTNLSMMVSEKEQRYKCYTCGAQGNVVIFVRDLENVSYKEAVKIVNERWEDILQKKAKNSK